MRPVAPSPHAVVLGHGPGAAAWPAPGLGTRLRALSIEGRWRLTPADAEPLLSRDAALTHLRTVGVPIGADALAGSPRLHRLAGPSDDRLGAAEDVQAAAARALLADPDSPLAHALVDIDPG